MGYDDKIQTLLKEGHITYSDAEAIWAAEAAMQKAFKALNVERRRQHEKIYTSCKCK